MYTHHLLKYYRKSLSDSKMLDIKTKEVSSGDIFNSDKDLIPQNLLPILNKYYDSEEIKKVEFLEVFVSPFHLISNNKNHNVKVGNELKVYPFWLPALIDKNGNIKPNLEDGFRPWISRSVLDPVYTDDDRIPIISTVTNVESILEEFDFATEDWSTYLSKAKDFFKLATDASYTSVADGKFKSISKICIIKARKKVVSNSLLHLYDELIKQEEFPLLVQSFLESTSKSKIPVPSRETIFYNKGHYGQFNNKFPLSESQRISLLTFETESTGKSLAVNGPPGTGKTTLLQSIVANESVKAVLNGQRPPMILASSTNNQAITNILDSISGTSLIERWIPQLNSFGSYLICNNPQRQAEASAKGYQILTRHDQNDKKHLLNGFYYQRLHEGDINKFKEFYISKFKEQYEGDFQISVKQILDDLKGEIEKDCNSIDFILGSVFKLQGFNANQKMDELNTFVEESAQRLQLLYEQKTSLLDFKQRFEDKFSKTSASNILNFLTSSKKEAELDIQLFLKTTEIEELKSLRSKSAVKEALLNLINEVELNIKTEQRISKKYEYELTKLHEDVKNCQDAFSHLNNLWELFLSNSQDRIKLEELYSNLKEEEEKVNLILDLTCRYNAFVNSVHYWEGQWLVEQEEQSNSKDLGLNNKAEFLQRASYLTPLFISTFQAVPSFCSDWKDGNTTYKQEVFDLLIVDEAGQVSPEIGVAVFSLAKKAIVVGDTYQIQPVWNINYEQADKGNLKSVGLLNHFTYDELKRSGMLCSSGSLMNLAQNSSTYWITDKLGGTLLTEHRRCCNELIEFSNKHIYSGLLKPLRGKLIRENSVNSLSLPPLGYMHIDGHSEKFNGGSLRNESEAIIIVNWILKYQKDLTKSNTEKLSKRLAIITPFAAQKELLLDLINKNNLDSDITVGTVHQLQGAERDIIIFSPTYGINHNGSLFFDSGFNMLNVALTRAKDHFLVMGNIELFDPELDFKPSGALAKFLFADEQNELSNALIFENKKVKDKNQRISTLDSHRKWLERIFQVAESRILIVSPFMSINAISADGILESIKNAVGGGVEVTIYTDKYLDAPWGKIKNSSLLGRQALTDAGANLVVYNGIHNKSIAVDDKILIEGSFNWLSASRDHANSRYEVSYCLIGEEAQKNIISLTEELELIANR